MLLIKIMHTVESPISRLMCITYTMKIGQNKILLFLDITITRIENSLQYSAICFLSNFVNIHKYIIDSPKSGSLIDDGITSPSKTYTAKRFIWNSKRKNENLLRKVITKSTDDTMKIPILIYSKDWAGVIGVLNPNSIFQNHKLQYLYNFYC